MIQLKTNPVKRASDKTNKHDSGKFIILLLVICTKKLKSSDHLEAVCLITSFDVMRITHSFICLVHFEHSHSHEALFCLRGKGNIIESVHLNGCSME